MKNCLAVTIAMLTLFAITSSAQQQTPGATELMGVTVQMLPDPPKSSATPPTNTTGPTFEQTIQWMTETAPQNSRGETSEDWGLAMYVVPGSTCSKTGFAFVSYVAKSGKAIPPYTDWISIDLSGIDPASVIPTGSRVALGSATPHIIEIAEHKVALTPLIEGKSASDVIKAYRKGKPLKTVVVANYSLGFGTPEYAQRFANALKHAVEVCGGTTASSIPTGQPF